MHRVPINAKIGRTRNNFSFLDLKVKATKGRVLITHFSFKSSTLETTFRKYFHSKKQRKLRFSLVFCSFIRTFAPAFRVIAGRK